MQVDKSETPPKHFVFFKARDNDAILSAFKEFTADRAKIVEKPSVLNELNKLKEQVKAVDISKVKNKSKEQSL